MMPNWVNAGMSICGDCFRDQRIDVAGEQLLCVSKVCSDLVRTEYACTDSRVGIPTMTGKMACCVVRLSCFRTASETEGRGEELLKKKAT